MSRDAAALSLKSNRTLRFGGNFTALIVSRIHLEDGSLSLELGYVIAGHLFLSMSFFEEVSLSLKQIMAQVRSMNIAH